MTLEDQLARDEGRRAKMYLDSRGIPTVGIGRNMRDVPLSDDEIDLMFANDVKRVRAQLAPYAWFAALDEVRQAALLNMAFNLGLGGLLHFPHMLSALAENDYERAATEALASDWAIQVGARADRIAEQIRTGEWQ